MQFSTSFVVAFLAASVIAHPGGHELQSAKTIQRRAGLSKRCAGAAGLMNKKRYEARMDAKRSIESRSNSTVQITTEAPFYEVLQNDTCILTPTVTAGPYIWPEAQTLRQDMSEGQAGVPLELDIGLLDMATCEPLVNALVDLWHCNATGSYSSFTKLSPNTPFVELLESMNLTDTYEIGTTDIHTDDTTFLRGMWPSDQNGMLQMNTIFPGFYVGRSIHIHARVYTNWTLRANGTLVSRDAVSTGQLFFEESLEDEIMKLEPYASHTQINKTAHSVDHQWLKESATGWNPAINIVAKDGVNMANGVIGYVTIGVDTTDIQTTILGGMD